MSDEHDYWETEEQALEHYYNSLFTSIECKIIMEDLNYLWVLFKIPDEDFMDVDDCPELGDLHHLVVMNQQKLIVWEFMRSTPDHIITLWHKLKNSIGYTVEYYCPDHVEGARHHARVHGFFIMPRQSNTRPVRRS